MWGFPTWVLESLQVSFRPGVSSSAAVPRPLDWQPRRSRFLGARLGLSFARYRAGPDRTWTTLRPPGPLLDLPASAHQQSGRAWTFLGLVSWVSPFGPRQSAWQLLVPAQLRPFAGSDSGVEHVVCGFLRYRRLFIVLAVVRRFAGASFSTLIMCTWIPWLGTKLLESFIGPGFPAPASSSPAAPGAAPRRQHPGAAA